MTSTSSFWTIINDVYDATNHALNMVISMVHTHSATTGQGGQLDWDDVWSDAVHSHASNAEGGTLDHGTALTGLTDDDHTQYQKENLLTTAGDMPYATGASAWARLPIGTASQYLRTNSGATAPEWASGKLATITRKTADETVHDSAVLQNDDHLLLALAASEEWVIRFHVYFNAGTTADIQFAFTAPTSATYKVGIGMYRNTNGTTISGPTTVTDATAISMSGSTIGYVDFSVWVLNSTNAGNFQMQWAQATQTDEDTKVLKGSWLEAYKVA